MYTSGENAVINNAEGGISYDGNNYIWSWATYNGTVFATAHDTISLPSSDIRSAYLVSVTYSNRTVSEVRIKYKIGSSSDFHYRNIGWEE